MKRNISIFLLFIALGLLIIYGADVTISKMTSGSNKGGFLNLNESIRGGVLGGGAVILSIIAFAISLREKSNLITILLLINGALIITGIIAISIQGSVNQKEVSIQESIPENTRGNPATVYGTIGLGILLIGLGMARILVTKN